MSTYHNLGLISAKSYKFTSLLTLPVSSITSNSTTIYLTTPSNTLHIFQLNTQVLTSLFTSVSQVSCNASMLSFTTTSGSLFTMGEDPEKFGLLGVKNCFSAQHPIQVVISPVRSISVGPTHVAALGIEGELYTWGSGVHGELGNSVFVEQQLPCTVQSAKIFMIKQVVCGKGFTAFCTAGGFLYIYGQLPAASCGVKKVKSPYTIPELRREFVSYLTHCEDFLVVFTDSKEVYTVDGCLECRKIQNKFSKVACSANELIGISKKEKLVFEFRASRQAHCKAANLDCKIFVLEEVFTDKVFVFSGVYAAFLLKSSKAYVGDLNLQYLSQSRYKMENILADCKPAKQVLSSMCMVLGNKFESLIRNIFAYLKFFAKCQNLLRKDTINLVLLSILNNLTIRCLIYKKNAWSKFRSFSEITNKRRKSKEFRRVFILKKVLEEKAKTMLFCVLRVFGSFENFKIKKIRINEKVFGKLSQKCGVELKKGFFRIRKYCQDVRNAKIKLGRLYELCEKELKIQFFRNLVQVSVDRTKMCGVINQILAFSLAKNSRMQILKFFQCWRRQVVNSKIAAISQKYARSIKTKKITEKIQQLSRKSLKIGFFSIKQYKKSRFSKLKLIFFLKIFNNFFIYPKMCSFNSIRSYSKVNDVFLNFLKKLIRTKLLQITTSLLELIKRRKFFQLMKILSAHQTKLSNLSHKSLYKAFCKLNNFERTSFSLANSTFSDSIGKSSQNKSFLPNLSIIISKPNDTPKPKATSPNTLQLFLDKLQKSKKERKSFKKSAQNSPQYQRKPKKTMTLSARQHPDTLNKSFNDFFSPKAKPSNTQIKTLSVWERQLMALAQSLLFSIYRAHISQHLNVLLNR